MHEPFRITGFLLDMDGVLLDTERLSQGCWVAAEEEAGYRMPEGFFNTMIGKGLPKIRESLREVMPDGFDVDAFMQLAGRNYDRALTDRPIPVKPGAEALLRLLSERRVPVCLATSTYRALTDRKLAAAGLSEFLPVRVCGDEVEHGKPHPDIYLAAAARLSLDPPSLLAVEDSENGLRAALAAGCQVAHVPDLGQVPLEVQQQADRIFRSLEDLREAFLRGEIVIGEN